MEVSVHRYLDMEELGTCICILYADAASCLSGSKLVADGSYTIM